MYTQLFTILSIGRDCYASSFMQGYTILICFAVPAITLFLNCITDYISQITNTVLYLVLTIIVTSKQCYIKTFPPKDYVKGSTIIPQ